MRPIRSLHASLLTGLLSLVYLTALAGETVLHPNDLVRVKISGVPLKDVKVAKRSLPDRWPRLRQYAHGGKIKIAGLTIDAAETAIESACRSQDIYTDPTITITILSQRR